MPQLSKGGKYIFGWSVIKDDLSAQLPTKAIEEYCITSEGKVFLISGSKQTGGFVVSKKGLLYNSKIGNILTDSPSLCDYRTGEGEFVKYKGRLYCWVSIFNNGKIQLNQPMLNTLEIKVGKKLLSIRSSDIAFCMGARGQLVERAENYQGEIEIY